MAKYRKKPVIVDAFQFNNMETIQDFSLWPDWLRVRYCTYPPLGNIDGGALYLREGELRIRTLGGEMTVSWGDWIIRGVQDEIYPCKPDIFELTHERIG